MVISVCSKPDDGVTFAVLATLVICNGGTLILCMGCHPHTRVNPAQCTIRKETQEPMWLQTIYKIYFILASNTRRE